MTTNTSNSCRYGLPYNRCDKQLRQYPLKYPIPKFTTRLPFKRNPLDLTIGSETLTDWTYRQLPTSQISAENYHKIVIVTTIMIAYFYPTVICERRYYHMLQDFIFMFIMDDNTEEPWGQYNCQQMDKCRRVWSQQTSLFTIVSGDGQPDNNRTLAVDQLEPFIRQIIPTYQDYYRQMNTEQWNRFVRSRLELAKANVDETESIAKNGRFVSLDEKLRIRRITVALNTTVFNTIYGTGIELPERDWCNPIMKRLLEFFKDHIIIVNDLFSFEKELLAVNKCLSTDSSTCTTRLSASDDNDNQSALYQMSNIVAMTAVDLQCPIQTAQSILADKIEHLEQQIIQLVNDWTTGASDGGQQFSSLSSGGQQFVRCILYIPGGNYRLSESCDRYRIV